MSTGVNGLSEEGRLDKVCRQSLLVGADSYAV